MAFQPAAGYTPCYLPVAQPVDASQANHDASSTKNKCLNLLKITLFAIGAMYIYASTEALLPLLIYSIIVFPPLGYALLIGTVVVTAVAMAAAAGIVFEIGSRFN